MKAFLTAEWRDLAILNYAVDPKLLRGFVPDGTGLDFFEGRTFVSLVGFRFLQTRVLGVPVPFHRDFDEVNLRFYVRRGDNRGVVFVREIVPRRAVAAVARIAYGENYVALPMAHSIAADSAEYRWRQAGVWNSIRVEVEGEADYPPEGSLGHFITEHYWGYSSRYEYHVTHPPWRLRRASHARFEGNVSFYGKEFAEILKGEPDSAILAEGSPVTVFRPSSSPKGVAQERDDEQN
jgi:uncharacterized protein YqjF (DUF2071 family)